MRVSAKTEYACLAMLELAARYEQNEPVRLRNIADAHGIPQQFLVQILLQLKSAGFVAGTRGAAGGYQLLKHPAEITLGEVMSVMDAAEPDPQPAAGDSPSGRTLWKTWRRITAVERELLDAVTFAELADELRRAPAGMYYI